MRSVLMALVVVWWCPLLLLPVLLGQQSQDNWDRNKQQGDMDKYDIFYPSVRSGSVQQQQQQQQSRHHSRRVRAVSEMDEADSFLDDSGGLVYRISAPVFFEDNLHLQLIPATDFISPGFVIQRVSGNYTWLEQIGQDPKLDCFFSGYVLGHEDSTVSLAMCDGMRGIMYVRGEKYFIEPLKNSSVSSPLHQRPHIIYQPSSKNNTASRCTSTGKCGMLKRTKYFITQFVSNCLGFFYCLSENYKHHRLKHNMNGSAKNATNFTDFVQNSNYHHSRHKRSPGVSREHTVETLVVADSAMFQYHGSDLQQYVLTLMSIVGSIYRHPSINNYINVVVVKFIMFQTKQDMPFNVSYDATGSLREFCLWQHSILDHNNDEHHDTAILITRENICRELGKCDTLGLAELGTICDPLRSCSIIEDNGLSSAFTIAHELGHVFNLPHDDDAQCKDLNSMSGRGGRRYHVMAPMLDANSSPWDWSPCSAHLMTEFIDAGLAECLRDAVKVNTLSSMVKSYTRPGWLYNADRQCHYIFGEGYGLCPYMNYPACGRLWCTNKTDSPGSGCRTQHMPWADGTQCGNQKMCQKGQCLMPTHDVKPVHGGWNSWSKYGPCSRTCGGGVKKQERLCNNPTPKDGGQFCLGQRTRYKSCNTEPCPAGSEDFRVEQCARYNGKVLIANLPPNAKWVPKYTGILMKDSCKLYCRVSHSSAYYQLDKKVEDGTKCGPFTDDICVNGQCWRAGCDNKLGSTMKRDRCGVCGGDNYTCRTVTGFFNNANYGYNHIITIPSGATEIDIRQHGHNYLADDDNYLALQNTDKEFILNGEFMVRTEKWVINVKGGLLDYSGSEENVERINSTRMIGEPIDVYVLSVGKLHPPNITYAYTVSTGDTVRFVWSNMGLWRKCSHVCRGKRRRKIVCVREDDNLIVSKKRCKGKGLKKPNRVEEPCNTECKLEWRVLNKGECSVRCGMGMRRQQAHCVKQTGFSQVEIVRDRECRRVLGAKPDNFVPCTGKCLPTFWSYTDWSQCSVSCGSGTKGRQARCVDEDGQELPDSDCETKDKVTSAACNTQLCPEWQTGDWLPCSATCGGGRKLRKIYCMQGEEKVNETLCDSKLRPAIRKECHLKECPEWYPGGWGPCSVTCDKGVSMRAVKCRLASSLLEDTQCDATKRPEDTQPCFMGACPTTPPLTTTTTAKTAPQAAFWRFGSWTECSATCGTGTKHRFVSCMDYQSQVINTSFCNHLPRPASVDSCVIKPCGDWHSGAWSDCTVTCGEGIQTRYVKCIFNEQITDESFCDIVEKPVSEHRCNRGTCISPDEDDFNVGVITSNRVEGSSRWLTWQWSACSVTCGMGWQRRHVMCHDEKGVADTCDKSLKPDEYQACQMSCQDLQRKGVQTRAVSCRLEGKVVPNGDCDVRQRPPDSRACEGACASPSNRWRTGSWSSVRHQDVHLSGPTTHFPTSLHPVRHPSPSATDSSKHSPTSRPLDHLLAQQGNHHPATGGIRARGLPYPRHEQRYWSPDTQTYQTRVRGGERRWREFEWYERYLNNQGRQQQGDNQSADRQGRRDPTPFPAQTYDRVKDEGGVPLITPGIVGLSPTLTLPNRETDHQSLYRYADSDAGREGVTEGAEDIRQSEWRSRYNQYPRHQQPQRQQTQFLSLLSSRNRRHSQ
ncbi:hypothetical protein C0Q70_14875 [Pomacea canaliculata]|uniref:Peptidase M12B domain-containing protein n=1 Tax=Pomacea canaliculata TaxID=400727 RepID=A0A2T7NTB5_POMCA|nr:hypothetical protein C0Q70_14875 [Pomacea canaliculata]